MRVYINKVYTILSSQSVKFILTLPVSIGSKNTTLNAAEYLQRQDSIGSIAVGKQADLVLLDGILTKDISVIKNIKTVFKSGVGYDSKKIFEQTKNVVGLH